LEKLGYAADSPGCVEGGLEKVGDERTEREETKLFEYTEGGQNRAKKRRTGEESKAISQEGGSSSSGGPAASSGGEAELRSRGGVPASAGASVESTQSESAAKRGRKRRMRNPETRDKSLKNRQGHQEGDRRVGGDGQEEQA
jgi:hypothetical protein